MRDTWCKPIFVDGRMLYGGAARNVRIAAAGGMDAILDRVARRVGSEVWDEATRAARGFHGDNVIQLRGTLRTKAA